MPAFKGFGLPQTTRLYVDLTADTHPTVAADATDTQKWTAYTGTGKLIVESNFVDYVTPPANLARPVPTTQIPRMGFAQAGSAPGQKEAGELAITKAIRWDNARDVELYDAGVSTVLIAMLQWDGVGTLSATSEATARIAIAIMDSAEDQWTPFTGAVLRFHVQEDWTRLDAA